jgi:hypothetical protein
MKVPEAVRLGFNDFDVTLFLFIYRVPLSRDAVPVQLAALSLFIPIQFMNLKDRPRQIVGVEALKALDNNNPSRRTTSAP